MLSERYQTLLDEHKQSIIDEAIERDSRKYEKRLKNVGAEHVRTNGSHKIYKHKNHPGVISVSGSKNLTTAVAIKLHKTVGRLEQMHRQSA